MPRGREHKPLDWHHSLEQRETVAGFASRLAALNGRSMPRFLRDMMIPPRSVDKSHPPALKAIATLGRVDSKALSQYTPSPLGDKFYLVNGQQLGRLSISRTYFRYCPHCIHEDLHSYEGPSMARPWLRLEWTLDHFRSCGRHQVFLDSYHPVRRRFEPFDFCRAVHGLIPRLANLLEASAKAPPSPFQDWLLRRIDGGKDDVNWLDDVPLYAAIGFCEALGVSALHPPKVKTSLLTEPQWAEAADKGYAIAHAGPDAICALLDNLNNLQSKTRGFWGPRDTYGLVYGLLQKTGADPAYEKFRQLVREFAIKTMPIEPGADVLGVIIQERVVHTIRTASRDSGAHALTIRKLFEKRGITEGRYESGLQDHRVTVEASDIQEMVEALKQALSTPQVELMTGIPRIPLKVLIADGHLPTITGSTGKAYAKHRFSEIEVQRLMERLFEGTVSVTNPEERQVSVQRARNIACASNSQILSLIMDGKLKWKGRLVGTSDYAGLLVDADEITRIVRSDVQKNGLTKLELKKFIPGMGRDSIARFIRDGLLETVEEFNPEARRMSTVISRSSAQKFLDTYVSLGELSQKSGLHHKQVRKLLRTAKIEAAFDPDEYQSFFYQREQVDEVQNIDPNFWQYENAQVQNPAKGANCNLSHVG